MTPDRYRLIRTVATGGMAHVYEAVAQGKAGFERRVALKRILPELADDEGLKRMFLDEARIASHLHHGNIVQVLDYGEVDDTEFIAMEYVDGVDVERAMKTSSQRGAQISEALALHITSEVAHALAHAHAREDESGAPLAIVHRDVSPHNVLLSWDGDVKLADFGIAKASMRVHKTQTGIVKGKIAYMAPEQAMGEDVGPPADVYSLGATLYALLNGAPPSLDEGLNPVSTDVASLVAACMEDDPAARPSAEEVARRAGTLANAGLERDARGALREWLTPLKRQGKTSALDDLMGLCLMSTEEGGERKFTVARLALADTEAAGSDEDARTSGVPTAAATPARRELERAAGTDTAVELPVRKRPIVVSVALVGGAIVAGALLVWSSASSTEVTDAPPTTPVEMPTVTDLAGPETTEALPSGVEIPAGPDEAAGVTSTPSTRRRVSEPSGRRPTAAGMSAPLAMEAASSETSDVAEAGFLRIPRGGAGQESIEVDGRARGFTPRVLELPSGAHRVVIRDVAGDSVLFDESVEVAAHHTRTSPLSLPR